MITGTENEISEQIKFLSGTILRVHFKLMSLEKKALFQLWINSKVVGTLTWG